MNELPVITTERICLRRFTMDDAEGLRSLLGDEDVMRYSVIGSLSAERIITHLHGWIAHYQEHGFGIWAVIFDNQLIGFCGVDWKIVDNNPQIQLSYRFNKQFWGKKLAYEAASAVCEYAFQRLGIKRIICLIDPENDRSIALALRLGMQFSHETLYLGHVRKIYYRSEE